MAMPLDAQFLFFSEGDSDNQEVERALKSPPHREQNRRLPKRLRSRLPRSAETEGSKQQAAILSH